MRILYHNNFNKSYKKLSNRTKEQFKIRLKLLLKNPHNPILNNHALHGEWKNYRSINVMGDYRAIYKNLNDDTIEFVIIDTHGNLY